MRPAPKFLCLHKICGIVPYLFRKCIINARFLGFWAVFARGKRLIEQEYVTFLSVVQVYFVSLLGLSRLLIILRIARFRGTIFSSPDARCVLVNELGTSMKMMVFQGASHDRVRATVSNVAV